MEIRRASDMSSYNDLAKGMAAGKKDEDPAVSDTVTLSGSKKRGTISYQSVASSVLFDRKTDDPEHIRFEAPINDINSKGDIIFPPPTPVAAYDGSVIVGTNKGTLMAFGRDAEKRWEFDLKYISAYNDPVLGYDGVIYVGAQGDTHMHAIDSKGQEKFDCSLPDQITYGPQVDSKGNAYLATRGQFHKIDSSGKIQWSSDQNVMMMIVRPDDNLLAITSDGLLHCIDGDRKTLWTHDPVSEIKKPPAFGPAGTMMIIEEKKLLIIDRNGRKSYEYAVGEEVVTDPLVDHAGNTYLCTSELMAVDSCGKKLWSFKPGGEFYSAPAIGQDGTLYFACQDENLYAVKEGKLLWQKPLNESYVKTPKVSPDGTICVNYGGTKLHIFDKEGNKKYEFTGTSGYFRISEGFTPDGSLMACDYEKVYALKERTASELIKEEEDLVSSKESNSPGIVIEGDWVIIDGIKLPKRHEVPSSSK